MNGTDVARAGAVAVRGARAATRMARRVRRGSGWQDAFATEARVAFEDLGPTYVKLGQMVASTPGLFPPFLVDGMVGCLEEVAPLPVEVVHEVIEAELGASIERLFSQFDDTPLASASIGQVHRAATPDGAAVVVKVQRPGIRDRIAADVRILRSLARRAEQLSARARLTQPVATVDDFAATIEGELSFMAEARAMNDVAAAWSDFVDADRVRVPEVYWEWTTPRLLTMEFVDGIGFADADAIRAAGVDPADVVKVAVRSWLHSTLVHGVFHGDLHAGNLRVDHDGRVVFLDFGIFGRLSTSARRSLFVALPALIARDFHQVATSMFSRPASGQPISVDAIAADLERELSPVLAAGVGDVSYAQAFIRVIGVGLRHGVLLPKDLILVLKQFFYVERYTAELAAGWQPLADPDLLSDIAQAAAGFTGWAEEP